MLKKAWLLLVAAALALAGCAVQPALAAADRPLPDNGQKAGVRETDGTPRANVPWVTGLPGTTPSADTVAAGAPASILGCEGYLEGWESLVECVENTKATWYTEAINARKGKTGFGWSDILKWASARDENGKLAESRVIEIFGHTVSDEEARRRAAEIVGSPEVASRLPIIRQPAAFMNTWTPDGESLQDYLFSPEEPHAVRVSLAPLKLNDDDKVIGLYINTPSGVFVDCANVWWIPLAVNTTSGEPPAPPSKPGNGTPPPATPGGGTPPPPAPPTPTPTEPETEPKATELDPVYHNPGNGGDRNEDPDTGDFIPPQDMGQAPDTQWNNPAPLPPAPAPKPTAGPALEIPPAPAPPPEQGAPTPDDPATGCVPAPGEDSC